MTDPTLRASLTHLQSSPASAVRRVLANACEEPAPCMSAIAVELLDGAARSIARVNHGSLTADEAEAARLACERHETVVTETDDEGAPIVAAPAGERCAVVCRLAKDPAGMHVERVRALGETIALAIENEHLLRERRRLASERVVAGERVYSTAAYDLHDGPAQKLLWSRNVLKQLVRDQGLGGDPALLEDLTRTVASALADIQSVIAHLNAAAPRSDQPIGDLLREEVALIGRREPIRVELELAGALDEADKSAALTAYRLVQEALTNAVRHGEAATAHVRVALEAGWLSVAVQDDGVGFDPDAVLEAGSTRSARLGLRGMEERVALLGGRIDISSRPGGPTRIHAHLPAFGAAPAALRVRPSN